MLSSCHKFVKCSDPQDKLHDGVPALNWES